MVTGLMILFALTVLIMMFKKIYTDRKQEKEEQIED